MDKKFEYDAFISYKAKGGAGWAELLWITLTRIAGRNIYIDHDLAGGTAHHLIPELCKIIDKSMNVIVIIFDGIQDVTESGKDVFLEEVKYAIRKKKNIIPFYVDGLSSTLIHSDNKFSGLHDTLKQIIPIRHSENEHSDIRFDKGYNFVTSLTKSFQTESEIRLKKEYLIRIQTDRDTSILIWGNYPIKVKAGDIFEHWLPNRADLHIDLTTNSTICGEIIKFSIFFDSSTKGNPYKNAYRQYHYLKASKDRTVLVCIEWSQIEEKQQNEPKKITDIL